MSLSALRNLVAVALPLTLISVSPAFAANPQGLQCVHLPTLFETYFQSHYSIHEMTDEIRDRTIDQYIKLTDGSKTLFLESDVAQVKKTLQGIFKTMQNGNCSQLNDVLQSAIKRSEEDEAFAKTVLNAKDYKVDESVELLMDPDKRGFPKTVAEKNVLLTKMIHFQISMRLSLEGIGASLSSQDGFTVIEDLIPGGGAEKLKTLKPKDKIVAVAQDGKKPVTVIDMDLKDVVKMIRGKKGTKVTLTILRQGEKTDTFDVSIVRDKIDVKDSAAKITYQTRKVGDRSVKIGVLELPSFYGDSRDGGRSSFDDMKKLLKEAKKEKAEGIVLNLSRNGGGLLEDAVRISGLFMQKGGVVATKDAQKHVQILADEDPDVTFNGPVVVLITHLSASASEILAGALKDYKRALIVGSDHTFGKGTVQVLSGLGPQQSLGAMKVTTGMFFLPGGESTQHKGVASDVLVPSIYSAEDVGEQSLDYSLAPQSTQAFLSKEANSTDPTRRWNEITPALVKKLSEKSQVRVSKDPKFAEIKKDLEDAAKNKGVIRLAEMKKKADKKKPAKGKAEREQKQKDIEAPFVDEGVNIMSDLLTEGRAELATAASKQ